MATGPGGQIVPNAIGKGWSIESQLQTVGLDPRGQAVQGVEVHFLTGRGHRGSVFIPNTRYNVDNARAAVAAAASQMDSVGELKG